MASQAGENVQTKKKNSGIALGIAGGWKMLVISIQLMIITVFSF